MSKKSKFVVLLLMFVMLFSITQPAIAEWLSYHELLRLDPYSRQIELNRMIGYMRYLEEKIDSGNADPDDKREMGRLIGSLEPFRRESSSVNGAYLYYYKKYINQ